MSRREIREEEKKKQKNKIRQNLKILILLIALIFIIVVIFVSVSKKQSSSNMEEINKEQIYYSLEKDEIENNIKILFSIKSDNGIKKVELPDGSVQEYNNENEVKIEYIVDRNGKYIIQITDSKDNVERKSVEITAISQ